MITKFKLFEIKYPDKTFLRDRWPSSRSQFYTNEEIKSFESLCRKLTYHINKYLDGKYIAVNWCDNKKTPIHFHYGCFHYNKDFSEKKRVDDEKMIVVKKALIKIVGDIGSDYMLY